MGIWEGRNVLGCSGGETSFWGQLGMVMKRT